ncbi:MAG: SRPBCC family protein [Gemmatimonadaceae bacterium]
MTTLTVTASRRIPAPPREVYTIIADYTEGHPHILPSAYFRNLEVEKGGFGAGTRIRFEMTALGTVRAMTADIEEPSPGRVLVERDVEGRVVTTFTVNPAREGRESDVTITTELQTRGGLLGIVERAASKAFLERVYRDQLSRLAAYAASGAGALLPSFSRRTGATL